MLDSDDFEMKSRIVGDVGMDRAHPTPNTASVQVQVREKSIYFCFGSLNVSTIWKQSN